MKSATRPKDCWASRRRHCSPSRRVALLIGLGISLLIANQVATPVRALRDATVQLGAGDFKAGEALAGFKSKDEIGELIGAFNVARDTFLRAARIQTALENTASVVLMADLEGKIIYANQAAQRYFRDMETEIRAKLSEFRAGEIGNTNVASFFGDNEAAQERLGELSETYRERARFGGRTVDLTANPVMNESGGRLGTVVEWVDVTDQLKVEAEIAEGVTSIKAATVQLTAGSQDLSARTEEQVASLEEMAASIRQLSVTVKQNADNAQQANQLALAARSAAEGGGEVAVTAVTAMGEIEQSSQRIAEIVGLIDEIAFQTNLLALNAAVEAARAGDAGRGFAVVAAEVRSLAQRSSQASKEIKGLISTSNGHVKRGVELVSKAGGSLGEIVTSVKKVADIVSEIAAASQEQSAGVQQVDEFGDGDGGRDAEERGAGGGIDGVGELRGPPDGAAVAGGALSADRRRRRQGRCPTAAGGPIPARGRRDGGQSADRRRMPTSTPSPCPPSARPARGWRNSEAVGRSCAPQRCERISFFRPRPGGLTMSVDVALRLVEPTAVAVETGPGVPRHGAADRRGRRRRALLHPPDRQLRRTD